MSAILPNKIAVFDILAVELQNEKGEPTLRNCFSVLGTVISIAQQEMTRKFLLINF